MLEAKNKDKTILQILQNYYPMKFYHQLVMSYMIIMLITNQEEKIGKVLTQTV